MTDKLVELTGVIVANYAAGNKFTADGLPELIRSVHQALANIDAPDPVPEPESTKATAAQIRKSQSDPDVLISFLDGRPYRTLKRHIISNGLTVEEYRDRFGLPADYPLTARNYSAARSEMAKSIGLGQKGRVAKAPVAKRPVGRPKKG